MYETCGTTAYGTMGRGAAFSSMQMRGSQHRFHRSLLLSLFFFFFCKNKPVKGRATVAFRSAVVSEQDCRLLACQNSFIYSNPSPVGAAPTHACWHTRTRARVHTRGNTKSNKKTIHSRKKGRDVFGALALAGDRSHSRPRVMCTE